MDYERFRRELEQTFPSASRDVPAVHLEDAFTRRQFDPCPDVDGMNSVKKQELLRLAVSCLEPREAYYEVGAYKGKSLISALAHGDRDYYAYACENFSEFRSEDHTPELLRRRLERHLGPFAEKYIRVFETDFRLVTNPSDIRHPIGVFFYDGAHDFDSQYSAIMLAERVLADRALVIVDDWRFAPDSQSYAERGTRLAIAESSRRWDEVAILPARFNGDHAMFWNGVGVFYTEKRT